MPRTQNRQKSLPYFPTLTFVSNVVSYRAGSPPKANYSLRKLIPSQRYPSHPSSRIYRCRHPIFVALVNWLSLACACENNDKDASYISSTSAIHKCLTEASLSTGNSLGDDSKGIITHDSSNSINPKYRSSSDFWRVFHNLYGVATIVSRWWRLVVSGWNRYTTTSAATVCMASVALSKVQRFTDSSLTRNLALNPTRYKRSFWK